MSEPKFSELVDLENIRQLLEAHHSLSKMAYALFDTDDDSPIAIGWQEICVRFHRANPITCTYCHESDSFIKEHLHDGTGPLEYRCKNNLIDIAFPIVLEGRHVATFFTGQFFCEDSPPDREYFIKQAKEVGFDVDEYLRALDKVPLLSREHIQSHVRFLHHMVQILAESGLRTLRLAREMEERKRAEEEIRKLNEELELRVASRTLELKNANERLLLEIDERKRTEEALRQNEQKFRAVFEQAFQFVGVLTAEGVVLQANQTALQFAGIKEESVLGKFFWETPWWTHSAEMQKRLRAAIQQAAEGNLVRFEATHCAADGQLRLIDFSLKPVMDADGHVVQLIPEGRDITAQRQAEERFQRQLHELQFWHDITLDREGRIQQLKEEVNQLLARLGEPSRYASQAPGSGMPET